MAEPADDLVVEAALADLARTDADMAAAARAGFESLTWGEGLAAVTGHTLADFLWYQLPTKWMCDLDEKQQIAAALGELFHRLGRSRYADMCASAATADILAVYEHGGGTAGFKAYRSALAGTGLQPPDLPGVLEWGSVMGSDEASAYASASLTLEHAIDNGELRPGRPGWRKTADQTVRAFLDSPRDELTGSTWLQSVHTERLQDWADGRGAERRRLATTITNQLLHPVAVPDTAADHLAPLQWLLDHAATSAALTQTGTLTRPLVADGCRRFDWLTLTANPRSESDIVELWTLRELAKQMGVVRRSGRKLLLSSIGKTVHAGGTPALWQATMSSLLGSDAADAAAGEVALLLLLSARNTTTGHLTLPSRMSSPSRAGGTSTPASLSPPTRPAGSSVTSGGGCACATSPPSGVSTNRCGSTTRAGSPPTRPFASGPCVPGRTRTCSAMAAANRDWLILILQATP